MIVVKIAWNRSSPHLSLRPAGKPEQTWRWVNSIWRPKLGALRSGRGLDFSIIASPVSPTAARGIYLDHASVWERVSTAVDLTGRCGILPAAHVLSLSNFNLHTPKKQAPAVAAAVITSKPPNLHRRRAISSQSSGPKKWQIPLDIDTPPEARMPYGRVPLEAGGVQIFACRIGRGL